MTGSPAVLLLALHPEDILPIAAVALLWVVLRRLFRGR